jgi:hypothetical protein
VTGSPVKAQRARVEGERRGWRLRRGGEAERRMLREGDRRRCLVKRARIIAERDGRRRIPIAIPRFFLSAACGASWMAIHPYIEVRDATTGAQLATRTLTRKSFTSANAYNYFPLQFYVDGFIPQQTDPLEFRVYWYANNTMTQTTLVVHDWGIGYDPLF